MNKPKFEPYIDAPDSERWWKRANAVGWSILLLWWAFPSLIPVRFGRWLFVALGLMGGCASFDYDWQQTRPASVKPWLYVTVTDTDFACRSIGSRASTSVRINGCAQWKPQGCTIYLPENAPAWIIKHETRHCLGWQHN